MASEKGETSREQSRIRLPARCADDGLPILEADCRRGVLHACTSDPGVYVPTDDARSRDLLTFLYIPSPDQSSSRVALFRVHEAAGAAASLPRCDTVNSDVFRSRPQHVQLDSKPWSCTNSLLITSMAFDSGWIVTAGKQLGTGFSGHTRLSVFQPTSATRLGPTKDRYRSSTHLRPRLYSTASAVCRGGQGRGQTKLVLAVPGAAAGQHK